MIWNYTDISGIIYIGEIIYYFLGGTEIWLEDEKNRKILHWKSR